MNATVVATPRYEREVTRLLAVAERAAMEEAISADPEAHPVVPGSGGVRKARWGKDNKGKRGGVRVIYYYLVSGETVYMISIYPKNAQSDMTAADRKAAKRFVEGLKNAPKKDRK